MTQLRSDIVSASLLSNMTLIEEQSYTHDSGDVTACLTAGPPAGPLMILCHGWPAIARTWKAQIETFAGLGYRVVAPDMPGTYL
jgi:soluble epoxide hydrolase / lipid-phosphate phosphatase